MSSVKKRQRGSARSVGRGFGVALGDGLGARRGLCVGLGLGEVDVDVAGSGLGSGPGSGRRLTAAGRDEQQCREPSTHGAKIRAGLLRGPVASRP